MTEESFIASMERHGQSHVIAHYRALSAGKKQVFLEEARDLDFDLVFSLYAESTKDRETALDLDTVRAAPIVKVPETASEKAQSAEALRVGEGLLEGNKVAVLIVAGGQGSRLGFEGPKGAFPVSPVRNKTLFRLFSESLKAISDRYNASIPLLIMTSIDNDEETRRYFDSCGYFGLDNRHVHFFSQGMLPSLTPDGRLVLKDETHFFTNPDGHGGSLKALHDSGILGRLIEEGVSELSYCQVDNPLVKIADPLFLGYHRMAGAEMSTKVVRRERIDEKVGVYVSVNGRDAILEYSDLGGRHMSVLDEQGNILYWGGNTAIHVLSLSFVERLNSHGFALPYHRAHRTIDTLGPAGPEKIEGWKFETFVFDAIPLAKKALCMEVKREEEFSPVKNSEGVDSPETARAAMVDLAKTWLRKAGITPEPGALVEISPLFALNEEAFARKVREAGIIPAKGDMYFGE